MRDDGTIVDMNHTFCAALDREAREGAALRTMEHPLALLLNDAIVSGEATLPRNVSYGSMAYEVIHLDGGNVAIVGSANAATDADRSDLEGMFLRSSCPMFMIDPSTSRIVDANLAAAEAYGHSRVALSAMRLEQIAVGQREESAGAKEGRSLDRHRLASGEVVYVDVSCDRVRFGGRDVLCATARPISQRERDERVAVQNEQKYRALSEASFEGVIIHSDFVILECNRAFGELVGIPPEQLVGTSILDLACEDSREAIVKQVSEKRPEPYEVSLLDRDGTIRLTEVRGREIVYRSRPSRVATFLDVTEERRNAKGLEGERARLRATLDSLPVGVIITDALGGFVETNERAADIWGGPVVASDLFDYDQFVAFKPESGSRVRPEEWGLSRAVLHGDTSVGEVVDIIRFDGSRRSIVLSAAPVRYADGEILGAVEITQDITVQKELEKRASIDKERAELYLNVLTHDINNLISVTSGYLQLIRKQAVLDERTILQLDRSVGALNDCHELIATIQQVQRAGEEAREKRDICALLSEIASGFPVPADREVRIENECEEGLIVESTGLLKEVFVNLLSNAISHNPDKVRIWIKGRIVDDKVVVSIEDDGRGIDDALKQKITERRLRDMGRRTGHGLGLLLMRSLVEDHGGHVKVEDRVPGDHTKGAKFVIELPLAEHGKLRSGPSAHSGSSENAS